MLGARPIVNPETPGVEAEAVARFTSLSSRQRDVARGLGRGLSYLEIANELDIGYESVKTYLAQARVKLGFRSSRELAVWVAAHRLHLVR